MPTQEQQTSIINQKNSEIITSLAGLLFQEFSHNISHEPSNDKLTISYTLCQTAKDQPINIDNLSEAIVIFLEFYVVSNFILPYHPNSPDQEPSPPERSLLSFKIRINNKAESSEITPDKIITQSSSKILTITNPLKSVIRTSLEKEITKHCSITSNQPLTLCFITTFNTPFNIDTLNAHLTNNLATTQGILKLYPIIRLYNTSPITSTLPNCQKSLRLTVAHIKNPKNKGNKAQISMCLMTYNTEHTPVFTPLTHLCKCQYNHFSCALYEIDNTALGELPDLQDYPLHIQDNTYDLQTATYSLTYSSFTKAQLCQQLQYYASLFRDLYGEQHVKLSISFSLKENITPQPETLPKCYSQELNPETNIETLLNTACCIPEQSAFSKIFYKKYNEQTLEQILSQYTINLHLTCKDLLLEPSQDLPTSLPPVSTTTSHQVQSTHVIDPTTQQPDSQATSQITHRTQTSSQTQSSMLLPVTTPTAKTLSTTRSRTLRPRYKSTQLPTIPEVPEHTPKYKPVSSNNLQTFLTNKSKYKKRQKSSIMCTAIATAILTCLSIFGYNFLATHWKFLAEQQNIAKINQTVTLGILVFFGILFIGYVIYSQIKTSHDISENMINNPTIDPVEINQSIIDSN
ncbi:hypothetical protein [Ehrlichia canis]|uniref:Uncharacterized protein n=1 Tax=Ehrlichia canis (strain Jake) TaxID=269484 RepID=A0ACA6AV85_EHRCJ|nr:hypothetical protein [Ehrlichia canis]AAZ68150.1 hypothetical protein Ecaj_0099 [Ehrlichia canis str. Jake]